MKLASLNGVTAAKEVTFEYKSSWLVENYGLSLLSLFEMS